MEPTEQAFENIESAVDALRQVADGHTSFYGILHDFSERAVNQGVYKASVLQLQRMADLFRQTNETLGSTKSCFMYGQLLGLAVVEKIGIEGFDTTLYHDISEFYTCAQRQAYRDAQVTGRDSHSRPTPSQINRSVSKYMTAMLHDELSLETIDSNEQDLFLDIVSTDYPDDDTESIYEIMQGYAFVRAVHQWNIRRRIATNEVASKDDTPAARLATKQKPIEQNDEFTSIMNGIEFDLRPMDGLRPCDDDLHILHDAMVKQFEYLQQSDIYDEAVVDAVRATLSEGIVNEFLELKTLRINDTITAIGNMSITITRGGEWLISYAVPESVTVRGVITEPDVMKVLTQQTISAALGYDENNPATKYEVCYDPYGLVFAINNPVITLADGDELYLAFDYENVKLYRDSSHDVL
jgi:hypothetical protein